MSLSAADKVKIVKEFQLAKDDTGSPEVQVAILSKRIEKLTKHMQSHKADFHSRRGLLRMVNSRRKLLEYINKKDNRRYSQLVERLGLRG